MKKFLKKSNPYIKRLPNLNNKKLIFIFIIFIGLALFLIPSTLCEPAETGDLTQQLEESVYEQLGNIDLTQFDEILQGLDQDAQNLFNSTSFWDKVVQLLDGDFGGDFTTFIGAFFDCFFGELVNFVPLLCIVIAVVLLCSLVGNIRSETGSDSVGKVINFVCYGVVIVVVSASVFSLLDEVSACVGSIKSQMDLLFPILLTLLASVGGAVSVGVFQPTLAILGNLTVKIFSTFLIPLFIFSFVFMVVGHMTDSVKLNKFNTLFNSIFKWVAGICFSIFMGAMVFQGIVAGSFDGVSIRATKFALKSYVPILGGYLSDGFNVVMASSVLIKNAVGMAGIILAVGTILMPIVQIAVFSLGIKLTASILEPMTKSRIPDFLMSVSKLLNMLVVIIAGIGFMYLVSVGMLLCTANLG